MTFSDTRMSGILLGIAGILFGTVMFFHPVNSPQGALEARWVPVHSAWLLAYLLLIGSFIPLAASGRIVQTPWAIASYWMALMGSVLSVPIAVWDAFIVPYLAKHAPNLIAQIEEISLETPVLVFRILFFLAVLVFSFGFLLYGMTLVQSQIAPRVAGIGLGVGAPLFWIGALLFSSGAMGNIVTEMGALIFGISLVILGIRLYHLSLEEKTVHSH